MTEPERDLRTDRNSRRNLFLGAMIILVIAFVGYIVFIVFFAVDDPDRVANPADVLDDVPAIETDGGG